MDFGDTQEVGIFALITADNTLNNKESGVEL